VITTETDTQVERRKEIRAETFALPATTSYTSGISRKTHIIKSTIINMQDSDTRTIS